MVRQIGDFAGTRLPGDVIAARATLQTMLPAGAARNAIDCALWDLAAKLRGVSVAEILGVAEPRACGTCFILSLGSPQAMAAQALSVPDLPLLKLKLGAPDNAARMIAVRSTRPDARLVGDANEGWSVADLPRLAGIAADAGLEMIEQPLPAANDQVLADMDLPVQICADESCAPGASIDRLVDCYDALNNKLDKAGGLTAALGLAGNAWRPCVKIMIGSMVSTSLSMAPAMTLASFADWIDLDSPLLLRSDRPGGMVIKYGVIEPPQPAFWG